MNPAGTFGICFWWHWNCAAIRARLQLLGPRQPSPGAGIHGPLGAPAARSPRSRFTGAALPRSTDFSGNFEL